MFLQGGVFWFDYYAQRVTCLLLCLFVLLMRMLLAMHSLFFGDQHLKIEFSDIFYNTSFTNSSSRAMWKFFRRKKEECLMLLIHLLTEVLVGLELQVQRE